MDSNAFDLTWRNYFPSAAQLCICIPSQQAQPIQLPPDAPLPQAPYNHQPQPHIHRKKKKRRQTDEGYVTGLESVVSTTTTDTDQNEPKSRGRRSHRKSRKRHPSHSRSQFYEIYQEENVEDARILDDQQIPQPIYDPSQLDDMSSTSGGYIEQDYQPAHNPQADADAIQAAQTLFTTKLVDLTDKLALIKESMGVRKSPDSKDVNASTAAKAVATLATHPEEVESDEDNDRSRARYSQLQNYNSLLDNSLNEADTPNYAEEGWSEHEAEEEDPAAPTSDIINRVMDIGRKWWSS